METSLRNDLVAEIYQETAQSAKFTAQLIPLAPKIRLKIQKQILSTLHYTGMEDRESQKRMSQHVNGCFVMMNENCRNGTVLGVGSKARTRSIGLPVSPDLASRR